MEKDIQKGISSPLLLKAGFLSHEKIESSALYLACIPKHTKKKMCEKFSCKLMKNL